MNETTEPEDNKPTDTWLSLARDAVTAFVWLLFIHMIGNFLLEFASLWWAHWP